MIASLLSFVARIYILLLIVRAVVSWFPIDPYSSLYRFLVKVTEPILAPIRSILPETGIDFSPILAILLIQIIVNILSRLIY